MLFTHEEVSGTGEEKSWSWGYCCIKCGFVGSKKEVLQHECDEE